MISPPEHRTLDPEPLTLQVLRRSSTVQESMSPSRARSTLAAASSHQVPTSTCITCLHTTASASSLEQPRLMLALPLKLCSVPAAVKSCRTRKAVQGSRFSGNKCHRLKRCEQAETHII